MSRVEPPSGNRDAAVITSSDSAAAGRAGETSGPLAVELLTDHGWTVSAPRVVFDEIEQISAAVTEAIRAGARLVVTTGGTGAGPRDVTPEALRGLGLRELPGLGEAIRAASRSRVPAADLSRTLGGILDGAVVLALPGSPGGVRDGLTAVGGLLAHAADIAAGGGHPHERRPAVTPGTASAAEPPTPAAAHGEPTSVRDRGRGADARSLVGPDPLDPSTLSAEVGSDAAGAVVTFTGIVRDHDHGRPVIALRYEAHPDAGQVLAAVLAEARTRPGVLGATAGHRTGGLSVGDVAFAAAVAAAHRAEAFAACAWLVDEVKARLPVWKHQSFADGTEEWVNCA